MRVFGRQIAFLARLECSAGPAGTPTALDEEALSGLQQRSLVPTPASPSSARSIPKPVPTPARAGTVIYTAKWQQYQVLAWLDAWPAVCDAAA